MSKLHKPYCHSSQCTLTRALFILPAKSNFSVRLQIFLHALNVIFCPLKNYHTIQKIMSVIVDVYKFDKEIFTIGTFLNFLYKYLETIHWLLLTTYVPPCDDIFYLINVYKNKTFLDLPPSTCKVSTNLVVVSYNAVQLM